MHEYSQKTVIFMKVLFKNALWRALKHVAFNHRSKMHLTDKLAQDIGIDDAELEQQRMDLPSQRSDHPML